MNKTINHWEENEIISLFKIVEHYKSNNKPVLKAFEKFALETNRKRNSVRNFYYNKLKEFEKTKNLAENLGINLKFHKKTEQKFFTPQEYDLSMKKINSLLDKGFSVRKACFEIASGNLKEMLRLQNKFRNSKAKNIQKTAKISQFSPHKPIFSENKSIETNFPQTKLLQMPSRKKTALSNDEIKSLFFGLLNLVKQNAIDEFKKSNIKFVEDSNNELRISIKKLADKEREYKILRQKFDVLVTKTENLKQEISKLRAVNATLLSNANINEKLNTLRIYVEKFNLNPQKNIKK